MANKNSDAITLTFISVFAVIILLVGAFLLGTNLRSATKVLGTTTSSNSTPTKAGAVASAAYSMCIKNGGFVTTARRGNSGYYNICNFADDMSCELYSLYNGQCPIGGVNSIGYDTTAQVFCALRGGKPQGSENGQCKMPDGKICSTASVYNGTCSPN